jgi:chemotaxis protein MotA
MKASSLIGVAAGGLLIALGATMEGSNVAAIMNLPAILIVMGGTFGAAMGGSNFEAIKAIPKLYKKAFMPDPIDLNARVGLLVGFAERARRDGLLALDDQLAQIDDAYTRKGLQLVVDGTDPEMVAEVLEAENAAMRKRHAMCVQPWDKAGGYAPTMGIIGTVFGLIHVLTNLSQPERLGPMISSAFIATLLGVATANVVYLPVSARLKGLSQEEMHLREMTLEGILSIQAGENPRFVAEKLITYVPPKLRPEDPSTIGKEPAAAPAAAPDAEQAAA